MKQGVILLLLISASLAIPLQFLKSNSELAPRGDVHFVYSPSEFTPSTITLKYSVGRDVPIPETPFIISGTNPVTVDNGVLTVAVYESGEMRVYVGSEVMRMQPSIFDGETTHSAQTSTVQVFPGNEMTYLVWQPFNQTFLGYRILRIWNNKPWIELDTLISIENTTNIDFRESINNLNVGSSSADNMQVLLKDQLYDGPTFSSGIVPTEGWILVYDGNDGFGISMDSDECELTVLGNDLDITSHKPLLLESGVQKRVRSYFQFMSYNLDFRTSQANFRGGWKYRFNSSSDWTQGPVGQVGNQNRYENSTFFLPQPKINTTLSSLTFDVASVVGSNPKLECKVNGHDVFEENVALPTQVTREIPVRWLEWGDNNVTCYSDGGSFSIPNIYLSLASVERMDWVYGGENWQYTSVNVLTNTSADATIELDMRDLGVTRETPTVIVLDPILNRIYSEYTYPILSFNSSVTANVTNSFFVTFGCGESPQISTLPAQGSIINYTTEIVETGGFGAVDILKSVHRERRISKKQIPSGSATGGAKTMIYDDGSGTILNLVVWR